jgi:phospholipase/carboxylesterase
MFSPQPNLEDLGPLKVARVKGDPSAPTIILFHGYGASAFDLYPLHQVLQTPPGTNWIFPDGHLEIPIAPGYTGKAWFPIDMDALQKAMMMGTYRDFSEISPQGLELAREKAIEMIDALGIPISELLIGGFSQGAMLSTDIALRSQTKPRGLCILSGTLLDQKLWRELATKKSSMSFFQSHGIQDPVLGYQPAKSLNQLLRDAGLVGEFLSFRGGHEIPYEVIEGLNRYFRQIFV